MKVGAGVGEAFTAADETGCGEALPEAPGSAITGNGDSLGVVGAEEGSADGSEDEEGVLELLGEEVADAEEVADVEVDGVAEVSVLPAGVGDPEADPVAGAGAGAT